MKTGLDTILDSAVDNGDVPGVVAMVVDHDGVLYEGAFGERSFGTGADAAGRARPTRSRRSGR